jgi:hypothetical protein
MGEIKSTLDIVMEKTKHLSLSNEERDNQKTAEIEKKIKGLLQKFQDQVLQKNRLAAEYEQLKKEYDLPDDSTFINEVFLRLDPDKDNQLLLALLTDMCEANTEEIESVLNDYQDELNSAASYKMVGLRENLAQKHFISGSAVVPNLETDAEWQAEAAELRSKFGKLLDEAKGKLKSK